jgi:ribonucleoside-triphosphate reductase
MDQFQEFVVTRSYCRWLEDMGRRESWHECVNRYYDYFGTRFPEVQGEVWDTIRESTINREVFPSMRALMTAGAAAEVDDTCLYNCSYLAINSVRTFSDILYILCCGTGVGFSCEAMEVTQLPNVPDIVRDDKVEIVVGDSRRGWAEALNDLLSALYGGLHPTWDLSNIRPKGSRLKTFGGRASGPDPLERLFKFVTSIFYEAQGRKLSSLEVHDIICMIGEIVISGGVRRSALISLSDLNDREMALAKSGAWWDTSGHRALSNNSAVYLTKPTLGRFLEEWTTLYDSKSGERGICNREAMDKLTKDLGREHRSWGTNPCSEIILRPNQFCNLSEVVIKPYDDMATLRLKVREAAILGTVQSACTRFTYLDSDWKVNCEEERLLGVSFTGIYDNKLMSTTGPELEATLQELRKVARETNVEWAEKLGITPSLAVTCCKPSGTTSCVAGTSSGIHPRFSEYYIRRVRIDTGNPLCKFMQDRGVPNEQCVQKSDTTIFAFPTKSPEGAETYTTYNPMAHLDLWLTYQQHWCDHKPSVTVNYTDANFMDVGQWVFNNWDAVSGISFLPQTEHIYEQAPFEAIDKAAYLALLDQMPHTIDWKELSLYELEDTTTSSHSLACHGGSCELVDITGD